MKWQILCTAEKIDNTLLGNNSCSLVVTSSSSVALLQTKVVTYIYSFKWDTLGDTRTCFCNRNGDDFGEVDQQKVDGNHLTGKEEHSEGDDYSGRTGRSRLGEVKEKVLRSSAECRWQMSFTRCPTAR